MIITAKRFLLGWALFFLCAQSIFCFNAGWTASNCNGDIQVGAKADFGFQTSIGMLSSNIDYFKTNNYAGLQVNSVLMNEVEVSGQKFGLFGSVSYDQNSALLLDRSLMTVGAYFDQSTQSLLIRPSGALVWTQDQVKVSAKVQIAYRLGQLSADMSAGFLGNERMLNAGITADVSKNLGIGFEINKRGIGQNELNTTLVWLKINS